MKRIILSFLAIIFSLNSFSQAPNWLWAKSFGDIQEDYVFAMAVDDLGNVYTTGSFQGAVDFDPGPGVFNLTSAGLADVFVYKQDGAGNFVWAKRIGGTDFDEAYGIALDASGNIYVTGYFEGTVDFNPGVGTYFLNAPDADVFVLKLDNLGNFVWAKRMGGSIVSKAYSLTIDGSGNIYVTGYFVGTVDFDPGPGVYNLAPVGGGDIFISKLNNLGNFVWAKAIGGTNYDFGYSIAADTAGNDDVAITGFFRLTADFDPDTGVFNLTASVADAFILKLDSGGNFLYASQINSAIGWSIAFDPLGSGNVFSTGEHSHTYIVKLDNIGNTIWSRQFSSQNGDGGYSITLDDLGNIYTAGHFYDTTDFDPGPGIFNLISAGPSSSDAFVCKLDSLGNFVWAKSAGGEDEDIGWTIALSPSGNGNVYLGGYYTSPHISFDNLTLTNADTISLLYDMFMGKLDVLTGMEITSSVISFSIFPNPATNELTVSSSEFGEIKTIEMYSSLGEKVFSQPQTSDLKPQTVDVSQLPPGIYFITVTDQAGNKVTGKVVKM